MIPNVVRGADFRGCLDYLFQKEKLPLIVATNMIGQSPAELAIEFEMIRQLNQRSTVPVWHVSLAARPDEFISQKQWAEVVDCFVRKVGEQAGEDEKGISPEENQFVAVAHGDRNHPHIHLVLNRVLDSGEVCYCKWDHNRAQQACREIEQELGLVIVTTQETAAEVEAEPKFRLPREIIAQLELQADRSGIIDPRLQQYYDHRRQRLEEIFDGNGTGVSHSTQDDQPTDSAATRTEAASLALVAATERTHAAVTHFVRTVAADRPATPSDPSGQPTISESRISTAVERSPQSDRSPSLSVESQTQISRTDDTDYELDFESITHQLNDRVADLSRSIEQHTQRRVLIHEQSFQQLDGTGIGGRVVCRLAANDDGDQSIEAGGERSQIGEQHPQTTDPTRSEQSAVGDPIIALQLAQFTEELQREAHNRRKPAWLQSESPEVDGSQASLSAPVPNETFHQRGDSHLSGIDGDRNNLHDLHRRDSPSRPTTPTRHSQTDLSTHQQRRDSSSAHREKAQVNSPQPEWTIEQKQQHYENLWHRFNEELPAQLKGVERDVQIAQRAIPQLGIGETSRLLCRSPHTQALLKAGNSRWQDHVHEVVGVAQERTLSPQQCQQGKWVVGVLERLLRDSNTSVIEGDRYSLHQDRQNHSLTLTAKDGRGTILKQSQGYIVQSNLSPQDLKAIEIFDRKLNHQAAERIQSNRSINKKSQSRGFEMGD
ncbi:MAG: relaxase/mobilization nuclease domain-containing protein [Leptolyngbyaceae cyanobacterium CSU_1_3]|nr:relaxase/mobilization nuclease domain-containing protein [Leptolyngbyaceae cyanobacterium CSU_1_3]